MSMIVGDNALPSDLLDEPDDEFWDAVHDQVALWLSKYGDEDDSDPD